MEKSGIDVSKWQGDIDWQRVKAAGITFAMVRSSFGTSDADPYFVQNVTQAVSNGIPCGSYHYCYAKNAEEARREAAFFLETVKGYRLEYPLALDLEDASLQPLGKAALTEIASVFLQALEDAGYYAILYSSLNWLTNYLDMEKLSAYDVWLAHWADEPGYSGAFGMWQYTSQGSVDGINGNVDRDRAFKDYPAIIRGAGLNHLEESPVPPVQEDEYYIVQEGDTLSSIAEKFGTTVAELVRLNNLLHPDLIYVGQKILLPGGGSSTTGFRVGDEVKIKASAQRYATGQVIPTWVKGRTDTILQISGNRALLKNIYSWVLLSDLEPASGNSEGGSGGGSSSGFRVGEMVRIKQSAINYATGQSIPDWVKGRTDTILQISGNRALLKNIYSWVLLSDLEPASGSSEEGSGGGSSSGFRVGETVKIKQSATNYATGQSIPDWVKGRADTILQLSGDRALLKNIYSWVYLKDLDR